METTGETSGGHDVWTTPSVRNTQDEGGLQANRQQWSYKSSLIHIYTRAIHTRGTLSKERLTSLPKTVGDFEGPGRCQCTNQGIQVALHQREDKG